MSTCALWMSRIEDYLRYRRRFGFALANEESTLKNFAAFADHAELPDRLTAALAGQWARTSKRQSPITWARRIEVLRGFARYWQQFDGATEIPERNMFGAAHRRRVPHIYSEEEILALLEACETLTPIGGLRPATCRIVFGLLAATGLRISEATQLRRDDVDLGAGVLTIREGKFHMSRLVPLHSTVTAALKAYADLRNRKVALPNDNHFFLIDNGSHATSRGMRYALRILCGQLGWQPRGDHAHHRLHDLRHGFIVRSTLRTMKQGGASDRDVLALSTYVGHVHISDTYWYLTGIPELMAIAAERFQSFSQGAAQ